MTDLGPRPRRTGSERFQTYRTLAAVTITILPLLYALTREMWELPYPISETVGILNDVGVLTDSSASSHSLSDPVLVSFFDAARRSWYRPMYWTTWYGFWHATHSLDATLLLFRILEVGTIALLVLGFVWQLKPRSFADYAAATAAVSVLIGMPGFRDNLELPLLMTLVGMLFALFVWMLLEREHRWWHLPLIVLFTVLAVGFKEQGLVLVPVIVMAALVGAPGARLKTAATITVLTIAYLALRFSTTGSWRPFEQDVGFGFESIPAPAAADRFGSFPYVIYAYNVAATVSNMLFSEPSGGVFQVVRHITEGNLQSWEINHVLTSTATTALLIWWAVHVWKRDRSFGHSPEMRLVVALFFAIAASGALGFNYSRDRLGGMAVVFYALASYYALRAAAARLGEATRAQLVAAGVMLMLLATGWQLRAIGTVDSVHARASSGSREWICKRVPTRAEHAGQTDYLRIFDALEPQGTAPIRLRTDEYVRRAGSILGSR